MDQAQGSEPGRLKAYLDRETKIARDRLSRSIGQHVRWARVEIRELAYAARMEIARMGDYDRE